MYIYWKEQCKYCINKDKCPYQDAVRVLINKLSIIEKSTKNCWGSLKWLCDYFILDTNKYIEESHIEGKEEVNLDSNC